MSGVLAVIGARLNSSRLPCKHLLDLAGKPLIARIFERLEAVPEIDTHVLATTADDYNRPFADWARQAGKKVEAWDGDVNDLTGRVDHVVRCFQPELVVYVCGDSPLVEPTTLSKLIQALKGAPHADIAYVAHHPERAIHEGFDVYTADLWRRIEAASTEPFHREHVGSARDLCKPKAVHVVDEPVFYRLHHRLSVDTPSDYRFMQRVYEDWYADHDAETLVSLPWLIERLVHEPDLRTMNDSVHQKGLHERSKKVDVVAAVHGDGRLAKAVLDQAHMLQDHMSAGVTLHLVGGASAAAKADQALHLIPHYGYGTTMDALAAARGEELIVFTDGLGLDETQIERLHGRGARLIGPEHA